MPILHPQRVSSSVVTNYETAEIAQLVMVDGTNPECARCPRDAQRSAPSAASAVRSRRMAAWKKQREEGFPNIDKCVLSGSTW